VISPDCRGRCAALALSCVLLALGCAGVGRGSLPAEGEPLAIDPEMTVRRIAPDAFVVTHEPAFASNVLVVRMPDGSLVLCSSPLDTVATRKMLQWARETFAPTRMVAINPHYHPDGTAGNEAYAESGIETWATDHTRRLLADHGARVRDEAAASLDDPALAARVRDTRITPAAHTIPADEPYRLTIGGEEVRVIPPGPAHSPDNVVILFPARGILFGGCMIKAGRSIGNTLDADLGNWEAAVRAIEGLGARLIVPGHGAVGGVELLGNTIEVVRAERARDPAAVGRKELEGTSGSTR
jgi:metallo-beta-lactamase class B